MSLIAALPTEVIGEMLVKFGCGMREPVTTSSWTAVEAGAPLVAVAVSASAMEAEMAVMATPVIIDEAISRVRMFESFKLLPSKQPRRAALRRP